MKQVRILGEMRTGTNYMSILLKRHYNVSVYLSSKHSEFDGNLMDTIITLKNPYSWMWSMLNCELVTRNTLFYGRKTSNHKEDWGLQKELVLRYNRVCNSYLQIPEDRKVVIHFIELMRHPERIVNIIKDKFNLDPITSQFIDEQNEIRSEERIMSNKFNRKEFYEQARYLEQLSKTTKKIIEENVDGPLLSIYGYDRWASKGEKNGIN